MRRFDNNDRRINRSIDYVNNNNDPSAGSPTETLLRLFLPLIKWFTGLWPRERGLHPVHHLIQSVEATGGVYKGQGRNQRQIMTGTYEEFLVQDEQLQSSIPTETHFEITRSFRIRLNLLGAPL